MGVTLPPEVAGVMQMLGPFPRFDEDDARVGEGGAVRAANASTVNAAAGADSSVRAAQQVYRGESATAMQGHWERTGTQNGHVAQANAAMRLAPTALEGAAGVVSAVKVAVGTQAVYTTVEIARLLAFGGVVGATAATARVLMRRQIVGRILREGSEGTGKVIAPIVRRRITEPMRRILDDLRRPGGPGGPTPALAGTGGRTVRPASAGRRDHLDNPNIATWGRKKNDGGGSSNNNSNNNNSNNNDNNNNGNDHGLNQQNRKPHNSNARKSSKDKHENAARHGGRRKIPPNPNKRKK
ncbi:hypothetical protein [Nonomuraea longicatena]|uniref:Uncharacterized protein n=1 Tax=Nonomuraea longicatena TaxID=83682 RepID=A0ABP3ZS50_9ACTN